MRLFFIYLLTSIAITVGAQTNYGEKYRPQYHYSVAENWLGAPIGVELIGDTYQFFYQHNPHNVKTGFTNWGHAITPDFRQWIELDNALAASENNSDPKEGTPWWGNTFRLGDSIKNIYCIWGEGLYMSTFEKKNFVRAQKMNIEGFDRSEPSITFDQLNEEWILSIYTPDEQSITFLKSKDLKSWTQSGSIDSENGFPQLIQLPVENVVDKNKWVIITDGGHYQVGSFSDSFSPETEWLKFDYGNQVGGSIIFEGPSETHLLISNLKTKPLADNPSCGQMTFPSVIKLMEEEGTYYIQRSIYSEIRTQYKRTSKVQDKKVVPGIGNEESLKVKGNVFHLIAQLNLKESSQFSIFLNSRYNIIGNEITYIPEQQFLQFEKSMINELSLVDNVIDIEILVDQSSLEIYIDGGRYVLSSIFSPSFDARSHHMKTVGDEIIVENMLIHTVNTIW